MAKHFGNLQRLKGVTYYMVSPHALKPFKGVLNPGLQNTIRRFYENFFFISIPFTIMYIVCTEVNQMHINMGKKNPEDFKNDV